MIKGSGECSWSSGMILDFGSLEPKFKVHTILDPILQKVANTQWSLHISDLISWSWTLAKRALEFPRNKMELFHK